MKIFIAAILLLGLNFSCSKAQKTNKQAAAKPTNMDKGITYLALGDSYTIGESVSAEDSYPYQIKKLLNDAKIPVEKPKIIATTGWTTTDLLGAIATEKPASNYSFVTLLIGVNNQYRGYDLSLYQKEFTTLLHKAISFANGDKSRVFVISIPDWGITPFAKTDGRGAYQIGKEIDNYNAFAQEITLAAGVSFTNITPASKNAATDSTLLAKDGLHPSGKMYAAWAEAVVPKIINSLN
ncbi:lysophospholipase L1-like esterase [Pedobacter sp. UYP30]|uniref:SGNH/GDSL hydrolase family protein n=1 Tax=Pedobacter sp. UYP30 TaxID=1756400 RepID=UPI003393C1E6